MTLDLNAALHARNFDVSFTLEATETVAVLGPNGAGKSTLLGIIAGLIRPDSGNAVLGQKRLFKLDRGTNHFLPPHTRGTALLAQEPLLFPHMSVLENVAFGPRAAGANRTNALQTAWHWLTEVEAEEFADRRPAQLSGGQAQRVAIARALATDPELLLLDEPMAALDIHAAPMLRRLLKRVLANRRAIIITHDVLDALVLADRATIIEGGRITEEGSTRQVLEKPRSKFAAGLAGMNLLPGTITGHGLTSHGGLDITAHPEDGAVPGQNGVAVFSPTAVSVFPSAEHGSPRNSFAVTITDLEPHGDQIRVHAGGLSADITPAASVDLGLTPGMRVHFVIKATAIAVYPA
ncbi:sulfate/molybdate ABC transporter ATP-binding protein [Arthrobacter nitrophenolicus]|uniref:Molybdate transport system ATP-binding protein n=2 Tax=Arthrobacter nitrophenolicus TaxID=683150 RepID=A0ACC6TH20_9MICC|nr:ABC transporter ATP-binding protein [Arthrobacter nitrophenolicus]ELT44231.1 ABC transporter-like protein [Arthrobacter nitrophenolicus]